MTLTWLTAVLTLLISSASAQVTQCAPDGSLQLRFVAQLSVSGCALTVHDTGANHTKHLVVEPLMCVTGDLHSVLPRYDPITQQTYVSVPVMLRDDAMLAEVERQLRHLSPESVKFATVTDISVSITDHFSVLQALGFVWNSDESVGFLMLSASTVNFKFCSIVSRFQDAPFKALDRVLLSATIIANNIKAQLKYRPTVQKRNLLDISLSGQTPLPSCKQLQFIRSIPISNCTARVHERLDMKGHFLIEPLLCHNITSMSNESVVYDYGTDTHYLKLDVVLQDDVTVDAVKTQLADLEPRSVAFMRLWRAQSVEANSALSRFGIGPIFASADWRSAQVQLHCRTQDECMGLRAAILLEPANLWQHIKWSVVSLFLQGNCLLDSAPSRSMWRMQKALVSHTEVCRARVTPEGGTIPMKVEQLDGRKFAVIQQRMTGGVNFQRNWTDYERGFGDPQSDFWIGLSKIHSLSINGTTLKVQLNLWSGEEILVEYAEFRVGDATSNYTMTYGAMLRSNWDVDVLKLCRGQQFSIWTGDRGGGDGWWSTETLARLNGQLSPSGSAPGEAFVINSVYRREAVRQSKLMLQIFD